MHSVCFCFCQFPHLSPPSLLHSTRWHSDTCGLTAHEDFLTPSPATFHWGTALGIKEVTAGARTVVACEGLELGDASCHC